MFMLPGDRILIILASGLSLALAGVFLIHMFFSASRVRRRQLKRLAQQQYWEARGTAHKHLLEQATSNIERVQKSYSNQRKQAELSLSQTKRQKDQAVQDALAQHLVNSQLQEIAGIGPKLANDIRRQVFRGQLSDLHRASLVSGIGQERQMAIDRWIKKYKKKMPALLTGEFPGKQIAVDSYDPKIAKLEQLVAGLDSTLAKLSSQKDRCALELAWLNKITPRGFVAAALDESQSREAIDRYQQGVFAEWERAPEWFQEVVTHGQWDMLKDETRRPSRKRPIRSRSLVAAAPLNLGLWIASGFILLSLCAGLLVAASEIPSPPPATVTIPATSTATATATAPATVTPSDTPPVATTTPPPTSTTPPSPTVTLPPTITATPTPTPTARPSVRPLFSNVNVRASPNIDSAVIGILRQDETASLIEWNKDNSWVLVVLADGTRGWIGTSVIRVVEPPDSNEQ